MKDLVLFNYLLIFSNKELISIIISRKEATDLRSEPEIISGLEKERTTVIATTSTSPMKI